MNSTNNSGFSDQFTEKNNYVIAVLSGISAFLNIICCLGFLSPKFKQKFQFRYIIINVFVETILCVGLAATSANSDRLPYSPTTEIYGSLIGLIIKANLESFLGNSLYAFTGLMEICLTYDRYLMLKGKKNWFNRISNFKYIVLVSLLSCFALFSPNFLFAEIRAAKSTNNSSENKGPYVLKKPDSKDYQIFVIASLVIANIFCVFLLGIASILVYIEYRIYIKFKPNEKTNKEINNNVFQMENECEIVYYNNSLNEPIKRESEISKNPVDAVRQKMAEIDFIKITLTLNLFYIFMRLVDMITVISYRSDLINGVKFNLGVIVLRGLCFDIVAIVYSLNIVILASYNSMFKNSLMNKTVKIEPIKAF